MCNRVWNGEGWPEIWKEGIVVPIVKKGDGSNVKDYRGVTLMPTLYRMSREIYCSLYIGMFNIAFIFLELFMVYALLYNFEFKCPQTFCIISQNVRRLLLKC